MALSIFEDLLSASIFTTGVHGDKIWDKDSPYWCSSLERGDAGGLDLTEYRLHVPFIHYPVPFLFARSHDSINRIARSSNMRGWSVGGKYDRPIPRRILEEAGIPRASFGIAKKAIAPAIRHGLANSLRPKALKDYNQFFLGHAPRTSLRRERALFSVGYLGIRLRKAYEKTLQRRIGPRARIAVWLDYYDTPLGLDYSIRPRALEDSRAFAWATGHVQEIYAKALGVWRSATNEN
jgi:hypothetical protein